jgi:hypothetical protein
MRHLSKVPTTFPANIAQKSSRGLAVLLCLAAAALASSALLACTERATSAAVGSQGDEATLFVDPGGSDRNECTKAKPCASFNGAYQRAQPGAVVEVAAGTYPPQVITASLAHAGASANVVIRPAPAARVVIDDELDIFGSNLDIRDMSMQVWYVKPGAHNVTMRRLHSGLLYITSASNVRVLGGEIGPWKNTSSQIKACTGCPDIPTRILIDGVTFHDYTRTNPAAHDECLQVFPASHLTIRRSTFRNCAIMDLLISGYGDLQPHDILIENNVFDRPGSIASGLSAGYYSLYIDSRPGTALQNIMILNNSALATMYISTQGVAVKNVSMVANVGPRSPPHCYPGVTFAYNVWDRARCGPTDRRAPPGFVDQRTLNLRLRPGAAAIGRGDPTNFPRGDILGTKRPQGRLPDAGAIEAR